MSGIEFAYHVQLERMDQRQRKPRVLNVKVLKLRNLLVRRQFQNVFLRVRLKVIESIRNHC